MRPLPHVSPCMQPLSVPATSTPIGVFDSGVGGLSVLRQLLRLLPHEDFIYLADTAWAPYGERNTAEIEQRSLAITRHLIDQHQIKLLVIACNTATAQAVHAIRGAYPHLPIVGIEPAIKPAAALTLTGHIGIMATQGTVRSEKFRQLLASWSDGRHMHVQACNGLALAIENALEGHTNPDGETVHSLCTRYMQALGRFAGQDATNGIDTLVLGCTHYPFAADTIQQLAGPGVRLIEPGEPVARHTAHLLAKLDLLRPTTQDHLPAPQGQLNLLCTATPERLQHAAAQWLHQPLAQVQLVTIQA